jgi:hypothetical protein
MRIHANAPLGPATRRRGPTASDRVPLDACSSPDWSALCARSRRSALQLLTTACPRRSSYGTARRAHPAMGRRRASFRRPAVSRFRQRSRIRRRTTRDRTRTTSPRRPPVATAEGCLSRTPGRSSTMYLDDFVPWRECTRSRSPLRGSKAARAYGRATLPWTRTDSGRAASRRRSCWLRRAASYGPRSSRCPCAPPDDPGQHVAKPLKAQPESFD